MPPVILDKLKHLVLNDMDLVDKGLTQLSPSFPFLGRMEFFGCKFIDETDKEAKVGFTLDMRNTSIGTLVFTESKNESPPSGLSFEVNNIRQNLLISVSSEVQGFTRYYISIGGKGSVKQVDMDQFESSLHDSAKASATSSIYICVKDIKKFVLDTDSHYVNLSFD